MTAAFNAQLTADTRTPCWWVQITTQHRCANTYASAVAPSTCTASDAGDGARCYFAYRHCQDRANFRAESHSWHFTSADVPMPPEIAAAYPNARAMVEKVSPIAQRIRFERSSTAPGHITVTLHDTGGDSDAGPFDLDKSPRNTGRAGLTLQRWLAQWPNFGRMTVTVRLGFIADGFVEADWETQFVGTLSGIEVNRDGTWTLRAEDSLTKLKKKLPRQYSSTVTVSSLVEPADTTWTLSDVGEVVVGDQFLVTGITAEEEIVEVTSIDTGANTVDVTRAVNGTTAGYVLADTPVQHVLDFKGARPMDIVQSILSEVGISGVNTTSFDAADLQIGPVALTRRIPSGDGSGGSDDQESASKLVTEILELFQCALYIDNAGDVAVAMNRPKLATETLTQVTDDEILTNTSQGLGGEPQRLTHVAVKWDEGEDDNDFTLTAAVNGETFVDDYYGSTVEDRREKKIESSWIRPGSSVAWLAAVRWSHVFAEPPRGLEWDGSLRQYALNVGSLVETNTSEVQDQHGANLSKYMVIMSRRPSDDLRRISFAAQASGFDATTDTGERWGSIAPNATPVYTSASDAEKAAYTFWGDADNLVNGETGYVVS